MSHQGNLHILAIFSLVKLKTSKQVKHIRALLVQVLYVYQYWIC